VVFNLLTARVHDGDNLHVFVSVSPKVCIPEIVCVLICNLARVLFDEFLQLKLRF
jgi:hypothetical protein